MPTKKRETRRSSSKLTPSQRKNVRHLLKDEIAGQIWQLSIGSLALIGSSLSNQAFPRLIGRVIDGGKASDSSNRSPTATANLLPTLGIAVLGGGLASFLRTTTLGNARDSIASRLRKRAFENLLIHKDIEWFQATDIGRRSTSSHGETDTCKSTDIPDTPSPEDEDVDVVASPGVIATIINDDVEKIAESLTVSFTNILRSCSSVFFSTYHMLRLDPTLFGAAATIIPAVGAAAMLLRRSIKNLTERQRKLASMSASFLEERLTHIAVVKMSNRENDEVDNYSQMLEEKQELDRQASMNNGLLMGFLFVASSGALLLVVNLGGRSVAAGKMSSGQLTSFATYSFLLGLGSSGIIKAIGELMQGMISAERYYTLLQDESTDKSNEEWVQPPIESKPSGQNDFTSDLSEDYPSSVTSISFRDVSFGYRSTGSQVLDRVSFKLECGKVTALVGRNGSGKSTTSALLAGLFKPWSGSIELSDGRELTSLSKHTKTRLVQVVPQSTSLFNMTILDNVRYSMPQSTEDDVMRAMALSNCDKFLAKLDGGINFVVGLNGSKLSGGERQRLALARALLTDPTVLVMDEPASSLDAEGTSAIEEAILACRRTENGDTLGRRRAMLLITHSAKSLELVDEVLVMKDGKIVEAGPLDCLRANRKSELCRLMPDLL